MLSFLRTLRGSCALRGRSGAAPLTLRVRKRSQVLRGTRGPRSSPSRSSTQEWGGYRPPGAHLCSQTQRLWHPVAWRQGRGKPVQGPRGSRSGAALLLRHRGLILPRAHSAPLAITVNSSPGDRQFPEVFFFFNPQNKSMVSPLCPLWKEET